LDAERPAIAVIARLETRDWVSKARWDTYSEDTILYLLAVDHLLIHSGAVMVCTLAGSLPLRRIRLLHHDWRPPVYASIRSRWVDYRNRRENREDRIDYFQNSINATLAHRKFCINLSNKFPGYGENVWVLPRLTARKVIWPGWAANRSGNRRHSSPFCGRSSLMFTPELSTAALRTMREKFGDKIYGRYGFVDAFNPGTGWIDSDVIGINIGIILLSAENARTGNVCGGL